jgi:hypothetical protein
MTGEQAEKLLAFIANETARLTSECIEGGAYRVRAEQIETMLRYLYFKQTPGSFTQAVLESNLLAAAAHADHHNRHALWDLSYFLYNFMPRGSYGSANIYRAHLSSEGDSPYIPADLFTTKG